MRRLLGVTISQALLAQADGQWSHALDIFARALHLAAPEGYMTLFLPCEGWPTGRLLHASRRCPGAGYRCLAAGITS